MKNRYKAVLFATDGAWVTDCLGVTIEDVEEQLADIGSRWIFYPIGGIIKLGKYADEGFTTHKARVVRMYGEFEGLRGTIENIGKIIASSFEDVEE